MNKRINPRRRPATQADVKRAKRKAVDDAIDMTMCAMLYVLVDKHGATDEELGVFSAEFRYVIDSISKGYLTWQDIRKTLGEEYNVHYVREDA